jgi:hypothetical protein
MVGKDRVPKGDGTYEATAVIASDGAPYVWWIQNDRDDFIFPT